VFSSRKISEELMPLSSVVAVVSHQPSDCPPAVSIYLLHSLDGWLAGASPALQLVVRYVFQRVHVYRQRRSLSILCCGMLTPILTISGGGENMSWVRR